jgi:hypothetical protein
MSGAVELIQLAIDLKREAAARYPVFAGQIAPPGLRSLLVSVAEQDRDQAAAMQDLLKKTSPEKLFSSQTGEGPAETDDPRQYQPGPMPDPGASTRELLSFLMTECERSAALYDRLRTVSADAQARGLFQRLAEESRRTHAMIESRYDLEALGGGI